MHEIEPKILGVDVARVKKRLIELGAKKVFDGPMSYVLYDFPDERLHKKDELLRIRHEGKTIRLTYKKMLAKRKAKVSEEVETTVADAGVLEKIFAALGVRPRKGYPLKKHRTSYVLGKVHFELDTFTEVPTWLEIEAPSIREVEAAAVSLGFTAKDLKPWGTREVFKYYRNKK